MKKEMREISITTDEEKIFITQPVPMNDDDTVVILPEQVDILIEWLKEAKAEIEREKPMK